MKAPAKVYTRLVELRRHIEELRENLKGEQQEVRTLIWSLDKDEAQVMARIVDLRGQIRRLRQEGDGSQNMVLVIGAMQQEMATLLEVLG